MPITPFSGTFNVDRNPITNRHAEILAPPQCSVKNGRKRTLKLSCDTRCNHNRGFALQYRPFRHPTEYPASLDSPISGMKISVFYVNETGAMLRTDSPLTTGTKIAFSFMHYTAAGTVM